MREPVAWLLPALAVAAGLGIFVGDATGPPAGAARIVAVLALAGAGLLRSRPLGCAACACLLAFALAAHGISTRLADARANAPTESFDAVVAAFVCEHRIERAHSFAQLCGLSAVPLGDRAVATRVPQRVQLVEARDSPEGAWLAGLVAGDRVRVWLRFDKLRGARNPGARDRSHLEARRGVGARARILDVRLAVRVENDGAPQDASWNAVRTRLVGRLLRAGPGGGLLAALALGDRRGLEPHDREAFRRLGISHLLAVSGLHLALVGALSFALARALLLRCGSLPARFDVRGLAVGIAVLAALLYATLSGWGVPVQRAWLFLLASLATLVVRRSSAPMHALSAGALVIGLLDPAALFELGAQLSFVATAALLVGARSDTRRTGHEGWRSLGLRGVASGVRVSATAIAVTAPLLSAHGLPGSPAGLVANVVAVPVTAFVLLPASLLAAAAAGFGAEAGLALGAAEWIARGCLAAVHAVAALLPATTHGAPASGLAVALAGIVAALGLVLRATLARVGVCVLVCAGLHWAPVAPVGPAAPRVVVFDVGQGDAILVQGRHATLLVDGGWAHAGVDLGRSVVVPGLAALGVERLDVVVASHADADHRGGLVSIVESLDVGEIWLPRGTGADFQELRRVAKRRDIPFRERDASDGVARRGDLLIETIWPAHRRPQRSLSRSGNRLRNRLRNDASLVLRVTVGGSRVLLTGDIGIAAEAALVQSGRDLHADLLKVAHHGSGGSSSPAFLEAVRFEQALLSASCSRRRRLPNARALARLAAAGGSVWWTGRDGALIVALRRGSPTRTWGWSFDPGCRAP